MRASTPALGPPKEGWLMKRCLIAAFVAQGLSGFDATKYGAYLHGKAGDIAAKSKTRLAMIASDIIDCIPDAVKRELKKKK